MMFTLTDAECDLIADALDIIRPDEPEECPFPGFDSIASKAETLARMFHNREENI